MRSDDAEATRPEATQDGKSVRRDDARLDAFALLPEEWAEELTAWGQPAFRGRQVFEWIHKHRVFDPQAMTNLPKTLRADLAANAIWRPLERIARQVDPIDGTRKYLFRLALDQETVETVLMRHEHGLSLCVSTQVGCRMGCRFCASTIGGRVRNLTPGEVIAQALAVQNELDASGERISHVVVMGMGEPLENYDATVRFLRLAHHPLGLNIGWRHLTVSTCGLVPEIRRLAEERLPITLAVSLHAPNDYLRNRIMPVNARYPIADLIAACRDYVAATGRRITFEYIMLQDVNDHPELARELLLLCEGLKCHVNLIPYNPVPGRPFAASTPERIAAFRDLLVRGGMSVTIRRTLGQEIDAACGQLRRARMRREPIQAGD